MFLLPSFVYYFHNYFYSYLGVESQQVTRSQRVQNKQLDRKCHVGATFFNFAGHFLLSMLFRKVVIEDVLCFVCTHDSPLA